MKKYIVKLNDKVYEVEMEEVLQEESKSSKQSAVLEKPVKASEAKVPNLGGKQKVEAPMPGKILQTNVKEGDQVKAGDLLLILEAMKMENEIVSPVSGRISYVGVKSGDNVNPGDILLTIE